VIADLTAVKVNLAHYGYKVLDYSCCMATVHILQVTETTTQTLDHITEKVDMLAVCGGDLYRLSKNETKVRLFFSHHVEIVIHVVSVLLGHGEKGAIYKFP